MIEGLGFWRRLGTSCRGGGVTPCGVCTFFLADSAVHCLSNLLRGSIENTGGEWLVQPTCRPGGPRVLGRVSDVAAATVSSLGNLSAARRTWEHPQVVVV